MKKFLLVCLLVCTGVIWANDTTYVDSLGAQIQTVVYDNGHKTVTYPRPIHAYILVEYYNEWGWITGYTHIWSDQVRYEPKDIFKSSVIGKRKSSTSYSKSHKKKSSKKKSSYKSYRR